jgi:hypothetical protein
MHDAGVIVVDGDCVIVNGRFSGFGEEQSKSKALGSMTDFRQIDINALGLNSAGLITITPLDGPNTWLACRLYAEVPSRLIAGEQFSKDSKSLLERRLGIFSVPNDSGSACFQFEANFMRLFGK